MTWLFFLKQAMKLCMVNLGWWRLFRLIRMRTTVSTLIHQSTTHLHRILHSTRLARTIATIHWVNRLMPDTVPTRPWARWTFRLPTVSTVRLHRRRDERPPYPLTCLYRCPCRCKGTASFPHLIHRKVRRPSWRLQRNFPARLSPRCGLSKRRAILFKLISLKRHNDPFLPSLTTQLPTRSFPNWIRLFSYFQRSKI